MKPSPSVIEVGLNNDMFSEGASLGGDGERSQKRGSNSRNPPNRHISLPSNDEEDYGRSLNRDNKHTRSNRKIKPMYGIGANGNMLKVV